MTKLEHQLKQEKTIKKAWQVKIKEYKQRMIDLGVDPNNPQPVKNLIKEKENEIHILKKKLKILETRQIQTPKLVALQ